MTDRIPARNAGRAIPRPTVLRDAAGAPAFAVLPWDAYEALRRAAGGGPDVDAAEDAADLAAHRAAMAEDPGSRLPGDVVKRLIAGDNPVRVFREWRGLKQKHLVARVDGLSQSYLSDIETGRRAGSVAVLAGIARALGVALDDLVPAPDDPGDETGDDPAA